MDDITMQSNPEVKIDNVDFELLRIVIIDSYCRGKKVEMRLDGHVSINGSNGAGKTTLLRLFPIFFGERPQRVIHGQENFSTHYFPATTSYIIYEYKRRDNVVMAVIHGNGQQDSVSYRYIDHAYDDKLFIKDNAFVQSQDLHKHLQMLGIFETNTLSRTQYRQILVNNALPEHRQHAARFAFVGSSSRLTHMNRVITGILNRVTDFEDLKQMVISSIIGDDKKFTLNTKKNELMKWIRELQSHESLATKRELMEKLEVADSERKAVIGDISIIHARVQVYINHLLAEKSELENTLNTVKSERDDSEKEHRNKLDLLQLSKSELDAQHKTLDDEIINLDKKFKSYQTSKIADACILVDAIDTNKQKAQEISTQIEAISGDIKNVDDFYGKAKVEKELSAAKYKAALVGEISGIRDKSQQLRDSSLNNRDEIIKKIQQSSKETIEKLRLVETDTKTILAALKERIKNVAGDPDIQLAIEKTQAELDGINNALGKIYQAKSEAEAKLNTAKTLFNNQELLFNETSSALEIAEGEYDKVLAYAKAGGDTLIGFLRTQHPEWVADIGRVIHEDLLLRSDLEPDIREGSSLYGLNVNLEKISASKLSSEESIQQDLQAAENRVKKLSSAADEDKAEMTRLSLLHKAAKDFAGLQEVDLNKKINEKTQCEAKLNSLKLQLETSKANIRANINIDLVRENNSLLKVQDEILIESAKTDQAINEQHKLFDTRKNEIESNEKEFLSSVKLRIDAVENTLRIELEELDKARLVQLEEKGVPQALLAGLEAKLKEITTDIKTAQDKAKDVREYREWLEFSYSKLGEKSLAINHLKIKVGESLRNIQMALSEKAEDYRKYSELISELDGKNTELNKNLLNAETHLGSFASWPKDTLVLSSPHDKAYTLMELISQKNNAFSKFNKLIEVIATGVSEIRQEMLRAVNTAPEQYSLLAEKEYGSPRLHHEYEWLNVARGWFNQQEKMNENKICQDGRQQGLSIKTFCDELESLKSSVSIFNREIRSSLNQANMFSRIENVDVTIKSDIDQQDYWHSIERLRYEYDAWHPMSANALPPASFVDAAKEVSAILEDERGLVANPSDLIEIEIKATINGKEVTAKEEKELQIISSNGLSYLVLAIVMVGFVNRIRGKSKVALPYAVDEVGDLDYSNSSLLLEFLANNNIRVIGAFPDIDERLSPLFKYKYNVLDDRRIALVDLSHASEELQYV